MWLKSRCERHAASWKYQINHPIPNKPSREQLLRETGRHEHRRASLTPLWGGPYPPRCELPGPHGSGRQPARLPAPPPLRSQLSWAWGCTSNRLHTGWRRERRGELPPHASVLRGISTCFQWDLEEGWKMHIQKLAKGCRGIWHWSH